MRRVKIDSIVYFSNEDPENPASNLLDPGVGKNKKWLCTPGEPFCSVVLQLERAVQISAVYLSSCQAGLLEVLVGRSETPTIPCQVLLPRIEFLSYKASRFKAYGEHEASFSAGELWHDTRDQEWDRVRVVCSNPFHPSKKYGLSFIEIYEVAAARREPGGARPPRLPSRMMALFDARSSSDEDDIGRKDVLLTSVQRPNNRADDAGQDHPPNKRLVHLVLTSDLRQLGQPVAPAPRRVWRINPVRKVAKRRPKKTSRRRKQTKPATRSNRQKKTPDSKDQEKKKKEPSNQDYQEPSTSKGFSGNKEKKTLNKSRSQNSSKDAKDEKKKIDEKRAPTQTKGGESKQNNDQTAKRNGRKRPYSDEEQTRTGVRASQRRPLGAVVFALSGYSAARGARLRAAAEALGARYQPVWSPSCTHLICSSANTAELRCARAQGASCAAVHGLWVERCGARRRRLPWQWFAAERRHRRPRRAGGGDHQPILAS